MEIGTWEAFLRFILQNIYIVLVYLKYLEVKPGGVRSLVEMGCYRKLLLVKH